MKSRRHAGLATAIVLSMIAVAGVLVTVVAMALTASAESERLARRRTALRLACETGVARAVAAWRADATKLPAVNFKFDDDSAAGVGPVHIEATARRSAAGLAIQVAGRLDSARGRPGEKYYVTAEWADGGIVSYHESVAPLIRDGG